MQFMADKRLVGLISVLMSLSLIGIILVQLYWIRNAVQVREGLFKRSVFEAMNASVNKLEAREMAHLSPMFSPDTLLAELFGNHNPGFTSDMNAFSNRMNRMDVLMHRMEFEALRANSGFSQNLQPVTMKELLSNEFMSRGITENFSFGILSPHKSTPDYSENKDHEKQIMESPYKVSLYPGDIFTPPSALSVYFPSVSSAVIKSMWGILTLSAFFTIFITFIFAFTMRIILRQKKLSDVKSDFINNMTHEFKTPIATISVAADTLTNPLTLNNGDKAHKFISIIKEENKRMNAQVEKVLGIARFNRGEIHLEKTEFNIHETLNSLVEKFRMQLTDVDAKITTDFHATNHIINGDPVHISGIFSNLLDNAVKYSPDIPEINVSTFNSGKYIGISVTDHGIGMSKPVQKRIFEQFYREPHGNLDDVKGFGLGLSYVKIFVENHHGKIEVKSEPGKGSTFTVFLPIENKEF